MSDDFPRGRFVWYELMTTDPEGAQAFYQDLVGWGTETGEIGGQTYTMWTNGGTPLGGVMRLPDEAQEQGAPSHWIPYVAVPDVDATVDRAKELGATVYVAPMDIAEVGRMAVLADPQCAIFAVYRSASGEQGGHDGEAQVGEFSWHELATTDHEEAYGFYRELFGWQKTEAMDMGPAGTYQMYGRVEDRSLGGIFNKPAEMPGPPAWLLYVRVPDVDQAAEKVKALGGQILNGPMDVPDGDRVVQCLDPQGGAFALHSTAA